MLVTMFLLMFNVSCIIDFEMAHNCDYFPFFSIICIPEVLQFTI